MPVLLACQHPQTCIHFRSVNSINVAAKWLYAQMECIQLRSLLQQYGKQHCLKHGLGRDPTTNVAWHNNSVELAIMCAVVT